MQRRKRVEPIAELPQLYTKMFWNMVTRSGSSRALVQSATLTLKYDLLTTRPGARAEIRETHYACDVSVTDVRGKNYGAHFEDWWYIEMGLFAKPTRRWRNPMKLFRR
jgi:hypothetical protein